MSIILAAVAWLLTYLVHSTLFLLGAAALTATGIVRSPIARDTLWKVALLGGLLTASAQSVLRLEPWPGHVALAAVRETPWVDVAQVRTVRPSPAAPESTPAAASFASDIAQRHIAELPPSASATVPVRSIRRLLSGVHISWPAILLQLWFFGALAFGVRLAWSRRELDRRLRGRRELRDGPLADALHELCVQAGAPMPRLTESDQLKGPIAFCREICVPARVTTLLAPAEQRAVLAHELGHIVRRDPAWLAVAACLESICCFQPLNRLARRRLREVSEYLCDDWAAEQTSGVVLASCLARVAEWVQGEPAPAAVAGMAGRCSELVSRVERLLGGATPTRPARLLIRASAGALALAAVAWSVPGVAAEDIGDVPDAVFPTEAAVVAPASMQIGQGTVWGEVHDDGRLIVFAPGFRARLSGHGRLGFRQYGRAIEVPDGYTLTVRGAAVSDARTLCEGDGAVRIEGDGGVWDVVPVRVDVAPRDAGTARQGDASRFTAEATLRATLDARALARAEAQADVDSATDAALDGEVDAAIDTLVQLWVRDPAAVRRAAHRIARTYDRDLQPQFESLGVQLGRELAPQLQRLTTRIGRDLTPEFQRLGAALGASIVSSLGDLDDEHPVAPKGRKRLHKP